jgi:hypothetical protein
MNECKSKEELKSVMRRVSKLLAISEDTRADPNEAIAAAAMAEKIMRKFQLENIDILKTEFQERDNFETLDACVVMKKGKGHKPWRVPAWAQWLATSTAKLHECEVRLAQNFELGGCVRFFGHKSDVQICGFTFDFLTTTVIAACRLFQAETLRNKAESDAYRKGFVNSLISLLNDALRTKQSEQASSSKGRDLLVVKGSALKEHFGDFSYKESKAAAPSCESSFNKGFSDGAVVDVNRRALGTTAGGTSLLLS